MSLWYCLRLLPASVSGMLKWGCSAAFTILRKILLVSPILELMGIGASIPISWLTCKNQIILYWRWLLQCLIQASSLRFEKTNKEGSHYQDKDRHDSSRQSNNLDNSVELRTQKDTLLTPANYFKKPYSQEINSKKIFKPKNIGNRNQISQLETCNTSRFGKYTLADSWIAIGKEFRSSLAATTRQGTS